MAFGKRGIKKSSIIEQLDSIDDGNSQSEDDDRRSNEEQQSQKQQQHQPIATTTKQGHGGAKEGDKPLLHEVRITSDDPKGGGGTKTWVCKHYNRQFKSSYTRIHQHFFGHKEGKKIDIKRCTIVNDRDAYRMLKKGVEDAEAAGVSARLKQSTIVKKRSVMPNISPLAITFASMDREIVDMKIMRCLCANAIPFNVLRSPFWNEMVTAINNGPKSYKSPSSEKARTSLLDECKRAVEKEMDPVKDTWYTHGVSVVSDGWSNCKLDQLINVIATNSRGAMYLKSECFNGVEKTGKVISLFLLEAIKEIGPSNVLQIVTDNAKNCIAAGKEIEKVHKHIFWSPCVCHTLNSVFKDCASTFPWVEKTYTCGKQMVKFFTKHNYLLALFKAHSSRILLKVAKTRFGSHYILLKRLRQCREALETTIVLRSWREWIAKQYAATKAMGILVVQSIQDETFWEEVKEVVRITKPIFKLLKFCDGDGPRMGEIYERMDNLVGEIKDIMKGSKYESEYCKMEDILVSRWDKMTIPLHCLGFALTPRFYDQVYLETPAPGGYPRKSPNLDKEVMIGCLKAFEKIAEDNAEEKLFRDKFAEFHLKKGIYSMPQAQTDAVTMEAVDWWSMYGSQTPELAEVAKKVLAQPISSSSAERAWSTFGNVLTLKRNRLLSCSNAGKLVFIHANLRLSSRASNSYTQGPYRKWDINPDDTTLEDSAIELEDMKWTGLDDNDDDDAVEENPSKRTRV